MFCPTCGARCPAKAIACETCGNLLPGLTDALKSVGAAPSPKAAPPAGGRTISPDEENEPGQLRRDLSGLDLSFADDRPPSAAKPKPKPGAALVRPARPETPAGVASVGHIKLVVEQGRILGEQFLLNEREMIIGRFDAGSGRCPDIDLTAQDPAYVHRQHVRLVFSRAGDQLMLYDMGGRNGSYLNNQLIEKNGSALVQLGDKIRVGRVVLRVQAVPESDHDRSPK